MKKLEKLTLKELGNEIALIGKADANCILGGTTFETMETMMEAGCWTGGEVDGMGYVGALQTVYIGSYTQTNCTWCTPNTYGGMYQPSGGNTQGGQILQAFNELMHSLGFHESATTYTTVTFTK